MLPLFVDSQFIFTEISQENKSFPHHSFTAQLNEAMDSSLNRFEDSLCPNDQNRRISHVQTIYSPFFETSEKYNEYMISSSYSVGDSVFKPLHSRGKIRQKLHCPSEKTTCDTASPSYDRDLLSKTSHKPEKVFFSNGNFEPEFPSAENVRKLAGYRTTENLTDDTKTSTELLYPERIIELKADRNQERPNNMIFNEKKEASNCADDEWKYWYGRVIGDEQEIKGGLEVLRRKPHNRQELRDAIRKWHDIQADKFVKEAKTSYY